MQKLIFSSIPFCFCSSIVLEDMAYWWLLQSAMWYAAIMVLANPLMPTLVMEVLPKLPLLIIRRLGTIPIESIWSRKQNEKRNFGIPKPRFVRRVGIFKNKNKLSWTRRKQTVTGSRPDGLLTGLIPYDLQWSLETVRPNSARSTTDHSPPIRQNYEN